jgi:hypothetical protein
MFTIFDLFEWLGVVAGLALGAAFGAHHLGWPGGVLGAFLGAAGGSVCGRMPFAIAW